MNQKDPLSMPHTHGPIVQLSKNASQRSLYSDHQPDMSPGIIKKTNNEEKDHRQKINPQPIIQSSKLQPGHLQNQSFSKSKQKNRYQNNELQNHQDNSHPQKIPSLSQFKRSSKLIASQNPSEFRHEYKNYKSTLHSQNIMDLQQNPSFYPQQSPKQLLKFHQHIKPKIKQSTFDQLSRDSMNNTTSKFNQLNSLDFPKINNEDIQNRSLRSSQGGRWLRSQSFMQQNEKKQTLHESLIKNYHKHESKYFPLLQKYLKIFTEFEQKLISQNFGISLMHPLEDIKIKMEMYMQKNVRLENLPIDKPTFQWTQGQLTKFFSNYEAIFLPPQSVDSMSQTLTLKKYKNCVYFGHMINGRKQQEGIIYYFNGKIFEGKFHNDQKIYGFEMQQDENEIYVGQFDKGVRHGMGILKNDRHLLWGKFANGQFSSLNKENSNLRGNENNQSSKFQMTAGTFTSNTRVKITNEAKPHTREGFKLTFNQMMVYSQSVMILKNSSNDLYMGNFNEQSSEKYGQGLQIFTNGDLYIGQYESNTPQHYGEYYWSSGAYYRGQFMSGMRHGKGKWHMLHGDMYQGEYMNDKKNGKGTYLWKNGAKYVGMFENDYRHGYGEMAWNDRRTYKGDWINGIEKNVQIKLDKGIDKHVKNPGATISVHENAKKTIDTRKPFLPGVAKRTLRSSSNPNTKNSFHTIDSSHPINKKIAIENIKALYNPSNH